MNDDGLATLLRERLGADEPTSSVDAARVIRSGRTRLRRRRVGGAVVATALLAVGALGTALVVRPDAAPPPASPTYPGRELPGNLQRVVEEHVPTGLELPTARISVTDGAGYDTPERYWDKASRFAASYVLAEGDLLEVDTSHTEIPLDINASDACERMATKSGPLSCTASADGRGRTVSVSVWPVTRTGQPKEASRMASSARWFLRVATVTGPGTLEVVAGERVQTPTLAEAKTRWQVPATDLAAIASDERLAFARPPEDPLNNCAWTVPSKRQEVSCGSASGP